MSIIMSGLDHSRAPIELREHLSFTKNQTGEIIRKIRTLPNILGCVLISTCNRTELYLSCSKDVNPGEILCLAASAAYDPYRETFVTRKDDDAIRHLMEVAAGLCSRIWGEDQIISQVKGAITIAREAGTADSVLETLFRSAVSAGKQIRTQVRLTALPTSAASMAVELLKHKLGDLNGKRAIVIGNGEMGRLSAALLYSAGCRVSVTLRTYRHGETIVPQGCGAIAYEERFAYMDGTDILVSATTSPHYTVTVEDLTEISNPPATIVDLAIPRDIQPEAGTIDGICLYNIDDLGDFAEKRRVPQEVSEIINTQMENFYHWLNYRNCITAMDSLKHSIVERILATKEENSGLSETEIVELSVSKAVDLLVGGLAEHISSDSLERCERKIRAHTIGR